MISKEDREQIKAFVDNKSMAEAVTKAVLTSIAKQGHVDLIDTTLDDAEYGRAVKANALATKWLTAALSELHQLTAKPSKPDPKNSSR